MNKLMTRIQEIRYHLDRLAELIQDDVGLMYIPLTKGVDDPMKGRTTFILRNRQLYEEVTIAYKEIGDEIY